MFYFGLVIILGYVLTVRTGLLGKKIVPSTVLSMYLFRQRHRKLKAFFLPLQKNKNCATNIKDNSN